MASVQRTSVVVTDLKSFLAFNEGLRPEELAAFLDTYYREADRVVRSFGGRVSQFIGDSVIALFTAKGPRRNAEQKAVLAAVALKSALARKWHDLPLSVGVATGDAVVGDFGPTNNRRFQAFGPVVTRACALERRSHITGFNVLLDSATRDKLNGDLRPVRHPSFDHPAVKAEATLFEIPAAPAERSVPIPKRPSVRTKAR